MPRILQEQLARFRQAHPALAAFKQLRTYVGFQHLYRMAQRWLAYVQPLRRTGEVQFFGDGDEVFEVAEFHGGVES
ncbi:hypothetical protein UNDYM_3947 [Undibacterium sp. YM2]|nr:hypothetical protein UNDYM_3947 [Undibacterium sp. YM2]